MEHLTTRPTPDLEHDLLKFLNNNCGQHCEEITLTATSAGERITATKPTECISYVVGRVKIPLSGREQNWNKVNIIPHLNCLGKAISSLNRFKIGLPKDNNNRFSVKIVGMLAPQGALYTIVLGWTQLFCDYHSFVEGFMEVELMVTSNDNRQGEYSAICLRKVEICNNMGICRALIHLNRQGAGGSTQYPLPFLFTIFNERIN